MKIKFISILLAVVLGTVLFSGCGNSKTNVNDAGIEKDSGTDNPITESSPAYEHIFEAGMYKVGMDIEAGEYIIFSNEGNSGYFCLSRDSNADDIITNDNFEYNSILTINDGEYLELSRCYAVPFDDVQDLDTIGHDGMFKVGVHIPAGEYKLSVSAGESSGYCCVYNNSRRENIEYNNNFDKNQYVTVKNGQYLLINRCEITDQPEDNNISEEKSKSTELNCPFTSKEFEEIYTSKLDNTKYDLSSEYNSTFHFWQLDVINEDICIVIEIEDENAATDTIDFYIEYGLEEGVFREIVSAFIETIYSDMPQEDYESLMESFTQNYLSEDGSFAGIVGNDKTNIVMRPNSISTNGVKISAKKK